MTKFSLIITAYNEIQLSSRLLDTVDVTWERFGGGDDIATGLLLALGYRHWRTRKPSTKDHA